MTSKQFNDTVKGVLAYKGGERFSQACNTNLSEGFTHGAMNVADAMGFEKDSLEWRLAMAGAMSHIETLR